jgi:pantoate--beta-alanine ligase
MIVIKSISEVRRHIETLRGGGRTIGFVPTMGALHEGHRSLLDRSHSRTDVTVMSIFVNPAQFGPREDLAKYPRMFDKDCAMAETAGCAIVFAPSAEAMYPPAYRTYVTVEELGGRLCGVSRPMHFRGVTTVVLKFFNIMRPDVAYFGQKDAQQAIIIKRMVEDLNVPVRVEVCETVREADGLAMSSRNAYLTPLERKAAPCIYEGLRAAATLFEHGERDGATLVRAVESSIQSQAPIISGEYIELVDTVTLQPLSAIRSAGLLAVACRTSESNTRLIDNIVIGGSL